MKLRDTNENQNRYELISFVELAKSLGVKKYLEIGSRHGDSLYAVMANLPVKALGVSIDIEGALELFETRDEIRAMGHDCLLVNSSSRNALTREMIRSISPFDLILIDGDHSRDGVAADWRVYGTMGKVIAFHDIANPENPAVGKLWQSIQGDKSEIVVENSGMGFGIVRVGQ